MLFAPWEKALGLLGDIVVPRADVTEAKVVQEPVREAMSAGMKAGLRLPWLYYVGRTIRLDQAFAVRRGVPALSFAVRNHGRCDTCSSARPRPKRCGAAGTEREHREQRMHVRTALACPSPGA